MGKIRKTASPKHEATLSPFVQTFVTTSSSIPLHQLPWYLATFPRPWPFMRGDLYHWIPVLNRFDDILESFIKHYALDKGPQSVEIGRITTLNGVGSEEKSDEAALDSAHLPHDADRIVLESILRFTTMLYESCANRALYASSQHLGTLLNTTSLPLLDVVLRLTLQLAHRYCTERVRMNSGPFLGSIHPATLSQHYMIDLDKLAMVAQPVVTNIKPASGANAKVKEVKDGVQVDPVYASDLSLSEDLRDPWQEFGQPWINFSMATQAQDSRSSSPSPTQRRVTQASNLGPSRALEDTAVDTMTTTSDTLSQTPIGNLLEIPIDEASKQSLPELVKKYMPRVPEKYQFQLLCRMRTSIATCQSKESRNTMLCVRLAAVANLAYIHPETYLEQNIYNFHKEANQSQTPSQYLCDLLHPPGKQPVPIPTSTQSLAMKTLDAMTNHRTQAHIMSGALGVTVNHGILTYLVRKTVDYLKSDADDLEAPDDVEWVESLFALLHSLPKSTPRAGEGFVAAGLLNIFVETLAFRTRRAQMHRHRVLNFLDVFVYNTRDAFNSMVNAGGLDVISDLLGYEVVTALEKVQDGHGLPENWKRPSTHAKITFIQQQILRTLFKVIKNMMSVNGGPFDRLLRNLIESSQLLAGLRTVITNPKIFGANVWCGAVEIFSQFIHNEPTSYTAIAEAGLTKAFLDTMVSEGMLPAAETICVVPTAFSAVCLSEAGMKEVLDCRAIDIFFDVLYRPAHLKALAAATSGPEDIGGSFDELVRHHPALRAKVIRNVVVLTERLRTSLSERVIQPKLREVVAKIGSKSFAETSSVVDGLDIEMNDVQPRTSDPVKTLKGAFADDCWARDRADPIVVVCGVLQGFFRNASLCAPFLEAGGIMPLIDIAGASRFDILHHRGQGPISRIVRIFIQHKPHLTTPLLVDRLQKTLDRVKGFIGLDVNQVCFLPYVSSTTFDDSHEGVQPSNGLDASEVLKQLSIARDLTTIITKSFTETSHRASTHPIAAVNLADMYIDLVHRLGKLRSRLIWEVSLMQVHAPSLFNDSTTVKSILDVYKAVEPTDHGSTFSGLPAAENASTLNNHGQEHSTPISSESEPLFKLNYAAVRGALKGLPGEIASLLQAIGQSILLRRIPSSDQYHKRCTYAIARSIADSLVESFDYPMIGAESARAACYFHGSNIPNVLTAMMQRDREAPRLPLSLVVWQFKRASGFDRLVKLGRSFLDNRNLLPASEVLHGHDPLEGLRELVIFFTNLSDSKSINDATQTAALSSRSDRDKEKSDYFAAGQLIVELRVHAISFILPIWKADYIADLPSDIVSGVCEILQNVLEASNETGSYSRDDSVSIEQSSTSRAWRPRNADAIKPLVEAGFAQDLALEAVYRCPDGGPSQQEYCEQRTKHGVPRFPIPQQELPPLRSEQVSNGASPSLGGMASGSSTVPDETIAAPMLQINSASEPHDLSINSATPLTAEIQTDPEAQPLMLPSTDSSVAHPAITRKRVVETDLLTVEDLSELRNSVRESLIDRSLFILSKFDDLSFALADLIVSSALRSPDPTSMRTDVGQTLIQSLISYQGSGNISDESSKIASCAHLLGIVLQDKDFFECAKDDLRENINSICQYVAVAAEPQPDGSLSWVSNILLILEKLLAEDAQPTQISWSPQQAEHPSGSDEVAGLRAPIVTREDRESLFTHTMGILPHVAKNSTGLGIAILRILVCLTRDRKIADQMSAKRNMQRLFLMIKQLAPVADKKLRGTMMLILRNVVEDTETVKQVMRSEIRALFEKQSRPLDTTAYVRHLHHCVLRQPEAFITITNEMVVLPSYDRSQVPQTLVLKKNNPDALQTTAQGSTAAVPDRDHVPPANETLDDVQMSAEPQDVPDEVKVADSKPPTLERNDGVTSFMLSELLAYKDVQDSKPVLEAAKAPQEVANPSSEDTNMENDGQPREAVTPQESKPREEKKPAFKAEDHPIFVYRCFLLQTLTELLQSYTCCKINFLNYSRKAEPQANTPAKPRSGVLNYILHGLIPTLHLQTSDNETFLKMKVHTAHWAINLIVALCTRTTEKGPVGRRDTLDSEDEPDLAFVRRFVLEHALKAYKEGQPGDSLDMNYSRYHSLGTLFTRLLAAKPSSTERRTPRGYDEDDNYVPTQKQIAKIMFEKNYAAALTASLSEVDPNAIGASRAIRHILQPLKLLTHTAIELSMSGDISTSSGQTTDEDAISSATSVSDVGDGREETPDLFRNSTLGMFEQGREDASTSGSSDDDDEEEMYGDAYADDMDFDEDDPEHDGDDVMSDEDEVIEGVGSVEGLDGDIPMEVEIDMGHEAHEHGPSSDDDSDSSQSSEDDDDDDLDDDEDDDDAIVEVMEEINGDNENSSLQEDEAADEWQDEEPDEEGDPDEDFDVAEAQPVDVIAEGSEDEIMDPYTGIMDEDGLLGGHQAAIDAFHHGLDPGHDHGDPDMEDGDDEDEDLEDEEDVDEDEIIFGEHGHDDEDAEMPPFQWGWPTPSRRHHHHRHGPAWDLSVPGAASARDRLFTMPGFRTHRQPPSAQAEDGSNPLLNRANNASMVEHTGSPLARHPLHPAGPGRSAVLHQDILARLERDLLGPPGGLPGPGGFPFLQPLPSHIESALLQIVGHRPDQGTFSMRTGPGRGHQLEYVLDTSTPRHMQSSTTADDPAAAVRFETTLTEQRWQEAARLLFGSSCMEKSQKIVSALLKLLVPPAIERDRMQKIKAEEEAKKLEEQRAKTKREREAIEAQEKKERDDRAAKDAAEAEVEAARLAALTRSEEGSAESTDLTGEAMEGVEETAPDAAPRAEPAETAEAEETRARVMTQIRGRELDITDLGIDTAYLDALPEEMREEVILQQVAEHRSQAAATGEGPTAISTEFLDALPPDIREELLQQEAQDRRRREREEARRQSQAQGGPPQPEEIDPASFIASLDPMLRQQVLAESDEDMLAALPADIAAEARALGGRHRRGAIPPTYMFGSAAQGRSAEALGHRGEVHMPKTLDGKSQRRPIVQMFDKAGIATLLRLMFVVSSEHGRSSIHNILMNASGNRQVRSEVMNGLLSTMLEGSLDANAVQRCFTQLTVRARSATNPKTPQSGKKAISVPNLDVDIEPGNVMANCFRALIYLAEGIPTIPQYFLLEHDVGTILKSKSKGKSKAKEAKTMRYPFIALLSILERDGILGNIQAIDLLSSLLSTISRPLGELAKKAQIKEKAEQETQSQIPVQMPTQSGESAPSASSIAGETQSVTVDTNATASLNMTGESNSRAVPHSEAPADAIESQPNGEASTTTLATVNPKPDEQSPGQKPHQSLTMPDVPAESLKPLINILMAPILSGQIFRHTITTITNFSAIPGAKHVFRDELLRYARKLGTTITSSLKTLIESLKGAKTEMEAQTAALIDFSPTGSDQTKFSRVITALNYLFEPGSTPSQSTGTTDISDNDLLSFVEKGDFMQVWEHLSMALQATKREGTEYFFNVATVLLPMIEALLVVCKRIHFSDAKSTKRPASQPEEGGSMREVFFRFTNQHKKILNDLVRQNSKLMNATFSVLVKNSTVLEFDNKRNFFNRQLHNRTSDVRPHPTLQLNVRRDQVFLDTYKNLHFKSPQEIKYGKFNIRFHNEEGVDAGGVTREWFQVLARQMFNPDYALFNPVASDRTTFHPNNLSWINQEHLQFFKFIGRIIGKALYENRVLDCHFSRAVYKKLLGQPVSLKDMETVDLEYSKNMDWMLNNDITDIITETFSLTQDKFGMMEVIDLLADGRNLPVTEDNKDNYVRKVIEYRLTGSVQEQLDSFLKGFYDIVPPELVSIFDEGELELLISGMPDVDVDDWKANTDYHNYNANSHQIQWFWRALRSFDKEERAKLLQFVTGTGKVPLNGFKELEGMNGFTRFSIHKDYGSTDRLPSSHTCFNQLDLPEYDNYETLRKSLYTAMTTGNEYFGYA